MQEGSIEHIRCVNCKSSLSLRPFIETEDVEEGLLDCPNCRNRYVIVSSVPFLVSDLSSYFSIRSSLGGELMLEARDKNTRSFIKESLCRIKKTGDDVTRIEKNWVKVYKKSCRSEFYNRVKETIQKLPRSLTVLEHGCSIGFVSKMLAEKNHSVFGIDKSFYAIKESNIQRIGNSDFFVSDSLNPPFGNERFDLVVALNLLDIVEPSELLDVLSCQTRRFLLLSDPYDFERGRDSVKKRMDEKSIRSSIKGKGFALIQNTAKPQFISWKLRVNERLVLDYKVDLLVGKKRI